MRKFVAASIACALLSLHLVAQLRAAEVDAGNYPKRPIHIVVPFPAGGPTDLLARIIGQEMTASWGQPVVIENRPGGNTTIGAMAVAKADPDGYTLLAAMDTTMVLNPLVTKNLPYDPFRDFEPISLGAKNISVVEVRSDSSAHSVKDLIANLKANPGKLNFGTPGIGTTQHFASEYFRQLAGLNMQHIPYRSTPQAIAALLAGEVQIVIELIQPVMGQFQSGTLRAIAVTSPQRFATVPDLPTFAESGLPGYDVTSWYGLSFAAGTPAPIVEKTNKAMRELLASAVVKEQILKAGALVRSSTPDELKAHIADEIAKWKSVREKAGIEQQ
jgi:tripartite-type tricarboxylate transporter receptor subunit TctC